MHVKCRIGHNSLDLIAFYQYPTSYTQSRPDPLRARGDLWTQLDRLLHSAARRNLLVVAGDFNSPLSKQASGHIPADFTDMQEVLKKYHLSSVRGPNPSHIYFGAQGSSCIDHVLLPKAQMDAQCRRGRSLAEFPVAGWRTLRDHIPVIASFPLNWKCWFNRPPQTQRFPRAAGEALYEIWQHQHPAWNYLQAELDTVIETVPNDLNQLHSLNSTIISKCASLLKPYQQTSKRVPPNNRSTIAQMWHSYAIVRRTQSAAISALFQAWHHFVRMHVVKKRLAQLCKRTKVQRLQQAVDEACIAATRHDTRTIFAIIRKLTPKQPYRAIRLRGEHGEALLASEECDLFVQHFERVFQAQYPHSPTGVGALRQMPFSQEELEIAFARAPIGKAVGPKSLPNFRLLSVSVAAWVWPALHKAWCTTSMPTMDAWLVLLAKRCVRAPTDIRPIALTDSIGRTVLGLLTQALKPQVLPKLSHLPIFAFVPGRGTLEALMFVCDHCRTVRNLCATPRSNQTVASPSPLKDFRGGLMLSIDMSQAFDRLPLDQLALGFDWLQVDPQLSQLFQLWLHEATYHFQHRRVPCHVQTTQGVRQGCKASPLEWTIFLTILLCRLDFAMPAECGAWVKKHLLTYADDLLARWLLASREDFHAAVKQIGIILDTLEALGMRINVTKSVILLRLSGQTKLIHKRFIHNTAGGKGLLIPRAHGPPTMLPIVSHHVYLGIKISYYNFEDLTLTYRLHIGHIAFLRLQPWLLKRHAYPLALRIQLWQMCVRSASLHGLQATGLTSQGLLRLEEIRPACS